MVTIFETRAGSEIDPDGDGTPWATIQFTIAVHASPAARRLKISVTTQPHSGSG